MVATFSRHVDAPVRVGAGLASRAGPLHHDVVALECADLRDQETLWVAGPAVQDQQHWVAPVLAANGDPLIQPIDRDEPLLVDPADRPDGVGLCVAQLQRLAQEPGARHDQDEDEDNGEEAARNDSEHELHP